MIEIGDISVDRKGNSFQYMRGSDKLVEWTIGNEELSEYDDRFVDGWITPDRCFSFYSLGGVSVTVDMEKGIHSFKIGKRVFQIELPDYYMDGNGNCLIRVYESNALEKGDPPIYSGGAILNSDFSWDPEGSGVFGRCVIKGRTGKLEGTFHNRVCTGTWSYVDQHIHTLCGTFEESGQNWEPKKRTVMKEYSQNFQDDTNSCIYTVENQGEHGFFCKEETFVLEGTRVNGGYHGKYNAYQPNDLLVFLRSINQMGRQDLSFINKDNIGKKFTVTYENNRVVSVDDYKMTMNDKGILMISYYDCRRVITINSVCYEDDSSSTFKSIRDIIRPFSIEGREGYQESDGVRITGLWGSRVVEGSIHFPNGVYAKGTFDRETKQPQEKCIFFFGNDELLQLEFKDPFVVIEWKENGYQFHGEYMFSLWTNKSLTSSTSSTNDKSSSWLSFLSEIADKGISFPERYENAVVSYRSEEWKEMTLFRRDILLDLCEEFLRNRCGDCYYSSQMMTLLRRSGCAIMVLKYGRRDSKVPKWATSFFPHGSALYRDRNASRDNKEAYFFYGMETLSTAEKEEGGTQIGSFTVYRLTRPSNPNEENLNYAGNTRRFEQYSVCRRGFCGMIDNKERNPFEDGRDFEVFRGEGAIVGSRFVMEKGTVRIILGDYVLSMEYERKDHPEREVYILEGRRLNGNNSSVTYKGGLEFENGIPIRCCGKGYLKDGNLRYDGFFTANMIQCARLYKNNKLQFCGTFLIKNMHKLYGWYATYPKSNSNSDPNPNPNPNPIYKLGGECRYWKMAPDWSGVEEPLILTDTKCPLFDHRFIYIVPKGDDRTLNSNDNATLNSNDNPTSISNTKQDPYVLVVDENDEVHYDLNKKTVTFGKNTIQYEELKTFSLPGIVL